LCEYGDVFSDYTPFENIRSQRKSSIRNSGGVLVLIRESFCRHGMITRIYNQFTDCIVLYVKKEMLSLPKDLIMYFTYVSPEGSVIYDAEETDGISLLNDKLTIIKSDFPDTSFLIAGDLNARVKDMLDYIPQDDVDFIYSTETDYPGVIFAFSVIRKT